MFEKALIPLPPTGYAWVFCAKGLEVQTEARPRPAAGGMGRIAISQSAKFCEGVQPGFKTKGSDKDGRWMGNPRFY
jgi:hypothetical protein